MLENKIKIENAEANEKRWHIPYYLAHKTAL
jgi:hypothetical protein